MDGRKRPSPLPEPAVPEPVEGSKGRRKGSEARAFRQARFDWLSAGNERASECDLRLRAAGVARDIQELRVIDEMKTMT